MSRVRSKNRDTDDDSRTAGFPPGYAASGWIPRLQSPVPVPSKHHESAAGVLVLELDRNAPSARVHPVQDARRVIRSSVAAPSTCPGAILCAYVAFASEGRVVVRLKPDTT